MGISAVVLTKNSEETLTDCLEAVAHNGPDEIVVVDSYSTDSTLDIARKYTNKIYHDEGKGICYARQMGAETATQEYIFYVDSDVVLPPGTMGAMLDELRNNGYGAMTARSIQVGGTGYRAWAARRYQNVVRPGRPGEQKATIAMKATIMPREFVLKYKFDTSTPSFDDGSICQRLIANGHKIAVSSAFIYHHHAIGGKNRGAYWTGVAAAEALLKYRKSPSLIMRYAILRGLGSPIHGMALSLAKGELGVAPLFARVFVLMTIGFTSKLLSEFRSALKLMWIR